jgi:hypothetical protein
MRGARSTHGREDKCLRSTKGRGHLLGRPRRRWEGNTKIDLKEVWYCGVDWIHVAQYRAQWRALVTFLW